MRTAAGALGAVIALILCWFGFDGTREGISTTAPLVAAAGTIFFAYGVASLMLLARAWATGGGGAWKLAAAVAAAPLLALLVSAVGKDGINAREQVALAEVAGLLLLNVLAVRAVARAKPR